MKCSVSCALILLLTTAPSTAADNQQSPFALLTPLFRAQEGAINQQPYEDCKAPLQVEPMLQEHRVYSIEDGHIDKNGEFTPTQKAIIICVVSLPHLCSCASGATREQAQPVQHAIPLGYQHAAAYVCYLHPLGQPCAYNYLFYSKE